MEKEKLQEFTFRVTQASRSELIVIMYDIILTDTQTARAMLAEGKIAEYEKELKHAARFMNELMGALDYRYAISYELLSLYSFANKALIRAQMQRKAEPLDDVDMVLNKLREAFRVVSEQDISGPVMQNTEQVYAGLTYGRNSLNESLLDAGSKRGFTA
ncbi:MAG: flagellar protein FliS [Lachnospiraceae bacterium]|nr:flagellar protein FliS [Lachnospiraceae bacterium]